jgi:hypothetical protein
MPTVPALRRTLANRPQPRHPRGPCETDEYRVFLDRQAISAAYRRQKLRLRDAFVERWPALEQWFAEPLAVRVRRLRGEPHRGGVFDPVSHRARGYLLYLGLRGHATFDYEWLLAVGHLCACELADRLGLDLGAGRLAHETTRLGFNAAAAGQAMRWSIGRIALHMGDLDPEHITLAQLEELRAAVRSFGERADIGRFYGSRERYRRSAAKDWITHLHQLHVVLFHRGQVAEQPRKRMPRYAARPPAPARMRSLASSGWHNAA